MCGKGVMGTLAVWYPADFGSSDDKYVRDVSEYATVPFETHPPTAGVAFVVDSLTRLLANSIDILVSTSEFVDNSAVCGATATHIDSCGPDFDAGMA
jgi:hypothetical protein